MLRRPVLSRGNFCASDVVFDQTSECASFCALQACCGYETVMSVMYNFVSSTGCFNIVTVEVLEHIHAFVGNTGHFGYEIDLVVSEGLECRKVPSTFRNRFVFPVGHRVINCLDGYKDAIGVVSLWETARPSSADRQNYSRTLWLTTESKISLHRSAPPTKALA